MRPLALRSPPSLQAAKFFTALDQPQSDGIDPDRLHQSLRPKRCGERSHLVVT